MHRIGFLLAVSLWLAFPRVAAAADADATAGRVTYEQVCAACHGPAGRLPDDSPLRQSFDPLPADFTDPLFNSREPAADWEMVITHGGHAMGLSAQMPAQGGALSAQDVRNVVAYVKTLADTHDYPPGEFNFFLPIRTKKAFPEDEVVWKLRRTERDGANVWRNVVEVEKRVGTRGQWLIEGVHERIGGRGRLEEVEVGYKHALAWDASAGWLLSGAFVVSVPATSDGEWAATPYLAWARALTDAWIVQTSARTTLPFDRLEDGALDLAASVHYDWSPWPRRVYPGIEVTAHAPFRSPAGDRVQYSVLPQVRIGLTRGGHVALNLGVEIPLSDQAWDRQLHAVLLWDFADGSFFKGW